jgi:hypothetical protein
MNRSILLMACLSAGAALALDTAARGRVGAQNQRWDATTAGQEYFQTPQVSNQPLRYVEGQVTRIGAREVDVACSGTVVTLDTRDLAEWHSIKEGEQIRASYTLEGKDNVAHRVWVDQAAKK